jgi:hypothetical protein
VVQQVVNAKQKKGWVDKQVKQLLRGNDVPRQLKQTMFTAIYNETLEKGLPGVYEKATRMDKGGRGGEICTEEPEYTEILAVSEDNGGKTFLLQEGIPQILSAQSFKEVARPCKTDTWVAETHMTGPILGGLLYRHYLLVKRPRDALSVKPGKRKKRQRIDRKNQPAVQKERPHITWRTVKNPLPRTSELSWREAISQRSLRKPSARS